MGREVRRVPPNWEHPRKTNFYQDDYIPMHEERYEDALKDWIDNNNLWMQGIHPDQLDESSSAKGYKYYSEWNGDAPRFEDYNTFYTQEEATWFQLYETVSEGTPVTPPFATGKELAEYLAEYGDFWYQHDLKDNRDTFRTKPTLEQAYKIIENGSCSMIVTNGQIYDDYQQQDLTNKKGG